MDVFIVATSIAAGIAWALAVRRSQRNTLSVVAWGFAAAVAFFFTVKSLVTIGDIMVRRMEPDVDGTASARTVIAGIGVAFSAICWTWVGLRMVGREAINVQAFVRSAAAVVLIVLGLFAVSVSMSASETVFPERLSSSFSYTGLTVETASATASLLGDDLDRGNGVFLSQDSLLGQPSKSFYWAAMTPRGSLDLVVVLLVGAILLCRTWQMGWIRKTICVLLVFTTPWVVAVTTGLCFGFVLSSQNSDLFHDWSPLWRAMGVSLAGVFVAAGWFVVHALVVDSKEEDSRISTEGVSIDGSRFKSPLLWGLTGSMLGLAAIAVLSVALASDDMRGSIRFGLGIPYVIGIVLLVFALLGQRWASRFLWLPLLFGVGVTGVIPFVLAAVVRNDEYSVWTGRSALPQEVRDRLERRRQKLPSAVGILLIAVALLSLIGRFLLMYYSTALLWKLLPLTAVQSIAAAAVGLLFVISSSFAVERKAWLRPAAIGSIVACGVLAVGDFAVLPLLPVHTQKQSVPWAAGVRVDLASLRITSFPTELAGGYRQARYFTPDGRRELPGVEVLDIIGLAPTDRSRELASDHKSNWILHETYAVAGAAGDGDYRKWYVTVLYWTGDESVVNAHIPSPDGVQSITQVDISSGYTGIRWPPFVSVRRYTCVPDRDPRRQLTYEVWVANGQFVRDRSAAVATVRSPWTKYAYLARIQVSRMFPQKGRDSEELARDEKFLASFVHEILRCLPTEENLRHLP